jgi:basic amino acid/polyamine antiporter, APA family
VLAISGLVGCGLLAFSLPTESIVGGTALLVAGATVYAVRRRSAVQRPTGQP